MRPGSLFLIPRLTVRFSMLLRPLSAKNETRKVHRLPLHINDPDFGAALVESFLEIIELGKIQDGEIRT
jgi:uncharacterized protein (UPF0261 family)